MSKLNITDQKMLDVFDYIIDTGKERFKAEICRNIHIDPQTIRNIRIGKQHFTAENIRLMVKYYNVNPYYILGLEDKIEPKKGVNKNVNRDSFRRVNLA